jgi:hypothetical protein
MQMAKKKRPCDCGCIPPKKGDAKIAKDKKDKKAK